MASKTKRKTRCRFGFDRANDDGAPAYYDNELGEIAGDPTEDLVQRLYAACELIRRIDIELAEREETPND